MTKDMMIYFDDADMLKRRVRAAFEIAKGAGCRGMVAGQVADIEAEHKTVSGELLDYIHLNKTASLIIAAVKAGAHLGGANRDMLKSMEDYAENLGLAFQIADDILDVAGDENEIGKKTGSDERREKPTYPLVYGMEKSKKRLEELTENALKIIAPYYDNAEFFIHMARTLAQRTR
jgi:geranylgeranyl diphosphate synthase type II